MPKLNPIHFAAAALLAALAFAAGRLTAPHPMTGLPPAAVSPSAGPAPAVAPGIAPPGDAALERGVPVALAQLSKSMAGIANEEERLRLIKAWAEKDPGAALDYVRTQLKGDRQAQALAAVLAIWARIDPEGAWRWVEVNYPATTNHVDTLLEAFGRNDPAVAARFAAAYAQLHPESALEVYLASLGGITYHGDYAAARRFIETVPVPSDEVRGNLLNFLAGQWARYQPQPAADWVMQLPAGPLRSQALIGLGESWSEVDPAAAAKFSAQLTAGEERQVALRQAISKWIMSDSPAARKWLLDLNAPHEDYDQAIASIATATPLMTQDAGLALDWANTISDPQLQQHSLGVILFNWSARDRAAAVRYVRTNPNLAPESRQELLRQLGAGD